MKKSTRLLTLMALVIASLFLFGTAYAGSDDAPRKGFLDLNGDGFNDNMADSDGDEIPNVIDEDKGLGDGDGSANQNKNAYAYAYKYAEQLKYVHELKHELFNVRKGEFKGDVPEVHGSWGDSGEANLNPVWSDVSGPEVPVGHKGESK